MTRTKGYNQAQNRINIMKQNKNMALVAHDNKKSDLVEWAKYKLMRLRGFSNRLP
jgi:hypothetical protein